MDRNTENTLLSHRQRKTDGASSAPAYALLHKFLPMITRKNNIAWHKLTRAKRKKPAHHRGKSAPLLVSLFLSTALLLNVVTTKPIRAENSGTAVKTLPEFLSTGKINGTLFSLGDVSLQSTAVCLRIFQDGEAVDLIHFRSNEIVYAASLTKVMTLITAVELIQSGNRAITEKVAVRSNDLAGLSEKDASVMGLKEGETISLEDLLYGLILPSGADAGHVLARELSGSSSAFVEEMNRNAGKLGLSASHFTNTSGLFSPDNVSSMSDMADLLHYAWQNPLMRKILSSRTYTTHPTSVHPKGIALVHTLESIALSQGISIDLIEGGKTGSTLESGYCLVTFKTFGDRVAILATSGAFHQGDNLRDQVSIYQSLVRQWPENETDITLEGAPVTDLRDPRESEKLPDNRQRPSESAGQDLPNDSSNNRPAENNPLATALTVIIVALILLLSATLFAIALIHSKKEKENERNRR